MEYTSHPTTDCTPLLSFQWKRVSEKYRHRFSIIWQGNIFRVKVQSELHGTITGQLVDIDVQFNQDRHHLHIINSMYHRSMKGVLPDLKSSTHRLVIKLTEKSFDLYEKKLEDHEITKEIMNPFAGQANHLHQPVKLKSPPSSGYDFQSRRNESWIMVSDRMETTEYRIAIPLNCVILWIKRIHVQKVNPNVNLFRYEFFSKGIRPLPLEMNGFVCTAAYDACKNTSNGVLCSICFEVTDRNGEKRVFDCHKQGEEGLLAFLHYMLKISVFHDWKDADFMRELTASLGISCNKIDDMLTNDLRGTGIEIKK